MQRLPEERRSARLLEIDEHRTRAGEVFEDPFPVRQPRHPRDGKRHLALLLDAGQPPLVLEPNDQTRVRQDPISGLPARFLHSQLADERLEDGIGQIGLVVHVGAKDGVKWQDWQIGILGPAFLQVGAILLNFPAFDGITNATYNFSTRQ